VSAVAVAGGGGGGAGVEGAAAEAVTVTTAGAEDLPASSMGSERLRGPSHDRGGGGGHPDGAPASDRLGVGRREGALPAPASGIYFLSLSLALFFRCAALLRALARLRS
jgi:hypothetical protein